MAEPNSFMNNLSEINNLMEDIRCATMALYAARLLPYLETDTIESLDMIGCGLDDTNNIHIRMDAYDDKEVIISASFTIVDDEIKCQLEVMDYGEQEKGIFDIPELKTYLSHHPSLQYKDNPEDPELNSYIDKDVHSTQIVSAFIATTLAVQELGFSIANSNK